MIIEIVTTGEIEQFKDCLNNVEQKEEVKSILILSCENNYYTPNNIDKIITAVKKPIFGGIFPKIISGKKVMTEGSIIIGLRYESKSLILPVPDNHNVIEEKLLSFYYEVKDTTSMFIFTDGLAEGINNLIDNIFSVFGLNINYFGGGAGSLEQLTSSPCIFSNIGLLKNNAIIVSCNMHSGLGVKHGWNKISEAIHITESESNTIKTIDWEPAYTIYKNIVETHSGKHIDKDNFFEIAKAYPFGISKYNGEMVVRDPIFINENDEIICVGEVPQNSIVNILHGTNEGLINAAKTARIEAEKSFNDSTKQKSLFLIDCISRVLFLGDKFSEELDVVYNDAYPLFGILSIGEIANTGNNFLEFYNKTTVAALLED